MSLRNRIAAAPPHRPARKAGHLPLGTLTRVLAECPMNQATIALMDAAEELRKRCREFLKAHPATGIDDAVVAAGGASTPAHRDFGEAARVVASGLMWVLAQAYLNFECCAYPPFDAVVYETLDAEEPGAEPPVPMAFRQRG